MRSINTGRAIAIGFIAAVAGLAGAGALVVVLGLYDISATDQHTPPVYWILDVAMRQSVARRAADIVVPPLDDPDRWLRGFAHYRDHCVQCHGAPGVAPSDVAKGLTPVPASLMQTGARWQPAEIYWVVSHGIKMTGMPAWKNQLREDALWDTVAFVKQLPRLSAADYRALPGRVPLPATHALDLGDPARGAQLISDYGCGACHRIPGIPLARGQVGPPLRGMAQRIYIAGVLPNQPAEMIRWLVNPQAVDPRTAMPAVGLSQAQARDVAAYLYTLD